MLNLTKGSALNLTKGASLNLSKTSTGEKAPTLWTVGLGWDSNKQFLSHDYDLDASVVMIRAAGENEVVYYGNKKSKGVAHGGDNLTGQGKGDDETISVDLKEVQRNGFCRLVFLVNIYEAKQRRQSFANVKNAYIRLLADKTEYAIFKLSEECSPDCYGIIFAEIKLDTATDNWVAQAIGNEYNYTVDQLAYFQ